MKSLKLDNTNDIILNEKKELEIVSGTEEVAQRNQIELLVNSGEWFLDLNLGIAWMDLFNNKATVEQIQEEIRNKLLNDNSIKDVNFIDIDFNDRILEITLRGKLVEDDEDFKYNLVLEV